MLVLTRKPGETILIGDTVVRVISNGKNRVRISIQAPREVTILRGELADGATDVAPKTAK